MRLTVLAGMPGAGKSTLAARRRSPGLVVVSLEAIRRDRGVWRVAVLDACLRRVAGALGAGRDVLVDACNTRRIQRDRWRLIGEAYGAELVLVLVDVPYEVALERQRERVAVGEPAVPERRMRVYRQEWRRTLASLDLNESALWDRVERVSGLG